MEKKETIIKNITNEIEKLENNTFNFYFFVIDTKGHVNGSVAYVYETALCLKKLGYSVKMLHAEEEFVGVERWLGEEYSNLPHINIESDGLAISPADVLIIPELYSNVMYKTFEKKLPCMRVALLSNFRYLSEIIPAGTRWEDYGIHECITTSQSLSNRLKGIFPNIVSHIVRPCIQDCFASTTDNKKMIVNVITDDKTDVNRIVKEFFWKYPLYEWVAFRDVRDIPREDFANALNEAFATVWIDDKTDFGYSALEAMKAKNIVIGKVPEELPDWAAFDGKLKDNVAWFYKNEDMHQFLADVIQSFLEDGIPYIIYDNALETVNNYSYDKFEKDVQKTYIDNIKDRQLKRMKTFLAAANNTEEEN